MKHVNKKLGGISKLGFTILVACLIAVPVLMGTAFTSVFNTNLVAFAANVEASPQSLAQARSNLDAAKQNQKAVAAQQSEAKKAYESAAAEYNAVSSEHSVAQKASTSAKKAAEQEFAAAKADAVAKVQAAQQNLAAANQKKAALETTLKEQEKAVQDAQKAYDDAIANSPEEVKTAAKNVQDGEKQQEIDEARVAEAQKRFDAAKKEFEAAKTYEKNASDRLDAAVEKEEAAHDALNKAQEVYGKVLEDLMNAGENPYETVNQAWEDAKTQVTKAENDLDKANQALIAARKEYDTAQKATEAAHTKLGVKMEELRVYSGQEYKPGMEDQQLPEYVELTLATYEDCIAPMSTNLKEKQEKLDEALENKTKAQEAFNAATKAANDAATEYEEAQAALQAIQDVYGQNDSAGIKDRAQERVTIAQGVKEAADQALVSATAVKKDSDQKYTDVLSSRDGVLRLYRENLESFTNLLAEKESEIVTAFPPGSNTYQAWQQLKTEYASFEPGATAELDALAKVGQANTQVQNIRYGELKSANEALQDAQATKDNLSTLIQRRDDLNTVVGVASAAHNTASTEKATAQTDSNSASQDLAKKQKAAEDSEQDKTDAENALAQTKASLVNLREAYKTALETYGADSTEAIKAASTSLETAQKNHQTTSAELENAKTAVSTSESDLKGKSELSNRLQLLSFAAALNSPVVEPGYEYLNSFVEKYNSLQAPLAAAADRMNAARATRDNHKRAYDAATGNLNRANAAVSAAQADYDRFAASSNDGNKKSTANATDETMEDAELIGSAEDVAIEANAGATKAATKKVASNKGIDPFVIIVGVAIAAAAAAVIATAVVRSRRAKAVVTNDEA